jgi:hypothetical protein
MGDAVPAAETDGRCGSWRLGTDPRHTNHQLAAGAAAASIGVYAPPQGAGCRTTRDPIVNLKARARRWMLVGVALVLVALALGTLSGALSQLPRAHTLGQQAETAVQLASSLLSVLVVMTRFRARRWASGVRMAWAASLTVTAGLSAFVWGPPMPGIALVFAGAALLAALALIRALRATEER